MVETRYVVEKMRSCGKTLVSELLDKYLNVSPELKSHLPPYLSGERCLIRIGSSRSFLGLNLLHNKADLTRAVMEESLSAFAMSLS